MRFTQDTDRPVAISGLEERLIRSFQVSGGFGVFDGDGPSPLRRSLLWRRAPDVGRLEMIDFQSVNSTASPPPSPPTWSWMAYNGAIQYLEVPFGRVEWEENEIRSPWFGRPAGTWSYSRDRSNHRLVLTVTARSFDAQTAYEIGDTIILDDPARWEALIPTIRCVILGKLRDDVQTTRKNTLYYVLLIASANQKGWWDTPAYRRVGVGIIPGSLFSAAGPASCEQVW